MDPSWLGLPLALHIRYFADVNNYTEMVRERGRDREGEGSLPFYTLYAPARSARVATLVRAAEEKPSMS